VRVFITGADGQLGHALQRRLQGHELGLGMWPECDLLNHTVTDLIVAARPQVVIHAAAYTDVDGAEREASLAMAVNADGTERVARAAARVGARLIYLSTDYVFDGTGRVPYKEIDPPNPLGAYGRSKLEGERRALAHCRNALVVRTAWLYGSTGRNFVKTIMKLTAEQPELRVVDDQRGCPTYAGDLAAAIEAVLSTDLRGIAHATGAGDCTWYELACAIVELMGAAVPVRPITTAEANRAAPRPAYTVLANQVLARAGITMPHWRDALTRFMDDLKRHAVEDAAGSCV
jgi:dTDP-4-dehydrorhamnose reductase